MVIWVFQGVDQCFSSVPGDLREFQKIQRRPKEF